MWYWGSSDINQEFLSPRELDTGDRSDKICLSGKTPYPYDNSGEYNRYDWQDLLNAGFLFPMETQIYSFCPQKDMKFCLFQRQFCHSIIECSAGSFGLKQPYDCREVTTDFRVALFFACQTEKDRKKDGKVVIFSPFVKGFEGIECLDSAELTFEYPEVYPSECDYYRRAKRQSAVLLRNTLEDAGALARMNERILHTIIIPSASKEGVLAALCREGINFDYLFPSLMACHRENATASGSLLNYVWTELARKQEMIDKYHSGKGGLNWIYDKPF